MYAEEESGLSVPVSTKLNTGAGEGQRTLDSGQHRCLSFHTVHFYMSRRCNWGLCCRGVCIRLLRASRYYFPISKMFGRRIKGRLTNAAPISPPE
jgi:hypothetical protein